MKLYLVAAVIALMSQTVYASDDKTPLGDAIQKHNAPVLKSRPGLKAGPSEVGGTSVPSMRVAFVEDQDFDKILVEHFPCSSPLRKKTFEPVIIGYTDQFFDLIYGPKNFQVYHEEEAKFFKKGKAKQNYPLLLTNGIFDCVNVVVDSTGYCGAMHVSVKEYDKESECFGRCARLLEKFPKEQRSAAKVSLISGSYSKLLEHIACTLKDMGYKVGSVKIGNSVMSRDEVVKIVSLSDLVPGTKLQDLRTLDCFQVAPFSTEVFSVPAYSLYDIQQGKHIWIRTPQIVKNIILESFFMLCLTQQGLKNEGVGKHLKVIKSFFIVLERLTKEKTPENIVLWEESREYIVSNFEYCKPIVQQVFSEVGLSLQDALDNFKTRK